MNRNCRGLAETPKSYAQCHRKLPLEGIKRFVRGTLVAWGLILIATSSLPAQDMSCPEFRPWELQVSETMMYDGNILRYSHKYLDRFSNGRDPGRFHVQTYDDLTLQSSLRLTRPLDLVGLPNSSISAQAQFKSHIQNSIKNWFSWNISWRQNLPNRWTASLSYGYLPRFYVRHYRDGDFTAVLGYTPETFKPFEFSKENVSFRLQHTLTGGTRLRLSGNHARFFYNQFFTEYDSRDWLIGLDAYHPFNRQIRASIGYAFLTSGVRGDTPYLGSTTERADGSFREHDLSVGFEWRLQEVFGFQTIVQIDAQWEIRKFTSTRPAASDPFHVGRTDHEYSINLGYEVELTPALDITFVYIWERRDTRTSVSENQVFLADEKDFTRHQVGLQFRYLFQF